MHDLGLTLLDCITYGPVIGLRQRTLSAFKTNRFNAWYVITNIPQLRVLFFKTHSVHFNPF